jgi:hypothetical protein
MVFELVHDKNLPATGGSRTPSRQVRYLLLSVAGVQSMASGPVGRPIQTHQYVALTAVAAAQMVYGKIADYPIQKARFLRSLVSACINRKKASCRISTQFPGSGFDGPDNNVILPGALN